MTRRLFVAIFPPPEILDALAAFLAPRQRAAPELRWTTPEQWHLTLAFMPGVPDARMDELVERLARAGRRRRPIELRLGGAGVFPDPYTARVLWIPPVLDDAVAEGLRRLAVGVRSAAAKAGAAPEGGRFKPHLTLARSGAPFEAVRWMKIIETWQSYDWIADEFVLVESRLGAGPHGRPAYEHLVRFPLG